MDAKRRTMLKAAGAAALAAAAGKAGFEVFAQGELPGEAQAAGAEAKATRWAMAVDLGKCLAREGCKDCIEACHRIHNVPDFRTATGEIDRMHEIKWIWKTGFEHAFPTQEYEHVAEPLKDSPLPVLCNHCDRPPCVRVCPTKATYRRSDGIVINDYHRCIGCRFCSAACPYGSRSFNFKDPRPAIEKPDPHFPPRMRGVVDKCNFCSEKIDRGGRPECVEVCPQKALLFGNLLDEASDVRQVLKERFAIRRKAELGTAPQVYYLV